MLGVLSIYFVIGVFKICRFVGIVGKLCIKRPSSNANGKWMQVFKNVGILACALFFFEIWFLQKLITLLQQYPPPVAENGVARGLLWRKMCTKLRWSGTT